MTAPAPLVQWLGYLYLYSMSVCYMQIVSISSECRKPDKLERGLWVGVRVRAVKGAFDERLTRVRSSMEDYKE